LAVVSGIREEVVTAAKKMAAVAAAMAAEGIWAVVLAAEKVAMLSVDNSGNGRAGNGNRDRGSGGQQQSTTMLQRLVAAVAAPASVAAAGAAVAATTAGADRSCNHNYHRPIYSRGGASCSTGNRIGNIQQHFGYFWHLQILFAPQIKLFAAPIIGAANNFICVCK
jgi:hypothetical protein